MAWLITPTIPAPLLAHRYRPSDGCLVVNIGDGAGRGLADGQASPRVLCPGREGQLGPSATSRSGALGARRGRGPGRSPIDDEAALARMVLGELYEEVMIGAMAVAKRRWSDATVARMLSTLRGFTRWLYRRGHLGSDPLDGDLFQAPARGERRLSPAVTTVSSNSLYRGAYQFDSQTWQAAGGDPPRPRPPSRTPVPASSRASGVPAPGRIAADPSTTATSRAGQCPPVRRAPEGQSR